jgi:hypothetical protein
MRPVFERGEVQPLIDSVLPLEKVRQAMNVSTLITDKEK